MFSQKPYEIGAISSLLDEKNKTENGEIYRSLSTNE